MRTSSRLLVFLSVFSCFLIFAPVESYAQSGLKKIRLASSSTNVSFLAMYAASHKGFYRDEGIDLEIIFMPANLASTAGLAGGGGYNGAGTRAIGASGRGPPT